MKMVDIIGLILSAFQSPYGVRGGSDLNVGPFAPLNLNLSFNHLTV